MMDDTEFLPEPSNSPPDLPPSKRIHSSRIRSRTIDSVEESQVPSRFRSKPMDMADTVEESHVPSRFRSKPMDMTDTVEESHVPSRFRSKSMDMTDTVEESHVPSRFRSKPLDTADTVEESHVPSRFRSKPMDMTDTVEEPQVPSRFRSKSMDTADTIEESQIPSSRFRSKPMDTTDTVEEPQVPSRFRSKPMDTTDTIEEPQVLSPRFRSKPMDTTDTVEESQVPSRFRSKPMDTTDTIEEPQVPSSRFRSKSMDTTDTIEEPQVPSSRFRSKPMDTADTIEEPQVPSRFQQKSEDTKLDLPSSVQHKRTPPSQSQASAVPPKTDASAITPEEQQPLSLPSRSSLPQMDEDDYLPFQQSLEESTEESDDEEDENYVPPMLRNVEGLPSKLDSDLFIWLQTFVATLSIVVLIFTFFFQVSMVSGSSMEPTLLEGDLLLILTLGYTPQIGDIVIINKTSVEQLDGQSIVKRVIALGGQTVQIDYDENQVLVDGLPIEEAFLSEAMLPIYGDSGYEEVVVPEGSVYVLGDNRNRSSDSRSSQIGTIDYGYVLGKVLFSIWPFSTIRSF